MWVDTEDRENRVGKTPAESQTMVFAEDVTVTIGVISEPLLSVIRWGILAHLLAVPTFSVLVFLFVTQVCVGLSVYCAANAEAIKSRSADSCLGSFIKWWSRRESWKDEANRRGCKSAEEGSEHKLMKHFLDDYPQVQLLPAGHSTHISAFENFIKVVSTAYWDKYSVFPNHRKYLFLC